ncbi:MAG TPA: hypothetical protein VKT75_10875 [Acidobacteriaceae bacterium]|nr:hypothetical protein [Acidobacteriaceae bacterium]
MKRRVRIVRGKTRRLRTLEMHEQQMRGAPVCLAQHVEIKMSHRPLSKFGDQYSRVFFAGRSGNAGCPGACLVASLIGRIAPLILKIADGHEKPPAPLRGVLIVGPELGAASEPLHRLLQNLEKGRNRKHRANDQRAKL